jgi:hypoxanthine phosphoribosyltransferase
MVEDIVDTGMTLNYLLNYLQTRQPASLKVCTLLDKRVRRLVDVSLEYVGFEVPDEFVVGYGLDYMEKYRNLPFIGILKPQENGKAPRKVRSKTPAVDG